MVNSDMLKLTMVVNSPADYLRRKRAIPMEEILNNLDPEKKDRIINAAIEEFASYPYDKASTNNIVKNAGISKGLLFHYFNSKKDLYETLIGFVIHKLYDVIAGRIQWEETDLFERIKQLALVKMEVNKTYPHMFDFVMKVLTHMNAGGVEDILKLYKGYGLDFEQMLQDIYSKNVDFTKFKDPSTMSEAIRIVQWTLEKYAEENLFKLREGAKMDFDDIVKDMDRYMVILKKSFYV
jgi:TetR/AcrR family transcriptional regulator